MSVQTQIDRIGGEVDTQASKLAELRAILEGKAAGSGGSGGSTGLVQKSGNCSFTVETMYEPGSDMYTVTLDDTSIDFAKCVEIYLKINLPYSISTRYVEVFASNPKIIGGMRSQDYTQKATHHSSISVPTVSFPILPFEQEDGIQMIVDSGYTVEGISYKVVYISSE